MAEFGINDGSRLKVDDFLQNYQLIINIIHRSVDHHFGEYTVYSIVNNNSSNYITIVVTHMKMKRNSKSLVKTNLVLTHPLCHDSPFSFCTTLISLSSRTLFTLWVKGNISGRCSLPHSPHYTFPPPSFHTLIIPLPTFTLVSYSSLLLSLSHTPYLHTCLAFTLLTFTLLSHSLSLSHSPSHLSYSPPLSHPSHSLSLSLPFTHSSHFILPFHTLLSHSPPTLLLELQQNDKRRTRKRKASENPVDDDSSKKVRLQVENDIETLED